MAAIKSTGVLANLSRENTIILIELYQRHECLWNIKLSSYRNIIMKKAAWSSVNVNFKEQTGIECTDENIQKKMLALRNNYTRELRISSSFKKSRCGTANVRAIKWPYFNAMTFLRGLINISTDTTSNLAPATTSNEEDADTSMYLPTTSTFDSHEPSQPAKDEPAEDESAEDESAEDESAETPSRPSTATPSRPAAAATHSRKFKRKATEDPLQSSLFQFIEEKRLKQEDPTSIWAKNVGATLNLIKNEKRRILARMEVEEVLHKFLREDLRE